MRVTPSIVLAYALVLAVSSCGGAWLAIATSPISSPVPLWLSSAIGLVTAALPQRATRMPASAARHATRIGALAVLLALASIVAVYLADVEQFSLGASLVVFSIGVLIGCIRSLTLLEKGVMLDLIARQP